MAEGTMIEPTLDYGYRDLGLVQNLRRQYLDAGFPYHTNDLTLAFRLYNLRKQYAGNTVVATELDRIFTNIVKGAMVEARAELAGVESDAHVLTATNLAGSQSGPVLNDRTNLPVFSTATGQDASQFYRVQ